MPCPQAPGAVADCTLDCAICKEMDSRSSEFCCSCCYSCCYCCCYSCCSGCGCGSCSGCGSGCCCACAEKPTIPILLGIYNSSSDDKKPSIEIKLTTTDDDDDDFLLDSSFNDVGNIEVDLAIIDLKRLLMIFLVINS